MKSKIIIIGAGAIGRGFLPWSLDLESHNLVFVDKDPLIVNRMKAVSSYNALRANKGAYEYLKVPIHSAFGIEEFKIEDHLDSVACFFSVGPRNVASVSQLLAGSNIPIISCENDPDSVQTIMSFVKHKRVYFAVPDVITSNTAPKNILQDDMLSVITEEGVLYIEDGVENLLGNFVVVTSQELIEMQWTAKLFLHNTPHCIAAYLGALIGAQFVHEAMENRNVAKIVEGAMHEMLKTLKMEWNIPHKFLDWYAEKELSRFRNKLLFDPISRVAREPLRKLEMHGRLIGAAQMCLTVGVLPINVLKGIVGALLFENDNDQDRHVSLMRETMGPVDFNRYVLGLRPNEPLDIMLSGEMFALDRIRNELKDNEHE